MIAAGVFAGAPMPIHWLASKPGTVALTVGISGRSSDASVTARARSFSERMKSIRANDAVDLPAKSIGDRWRAAAIGDEDDICSGQHLEQFAGDMLRRADRRCSNIDLSGFRIGVSDQS
jgi:hypothetical protein